MMSEATIDSGTSPVALALRLPMWAGKVTRLLDSQPHNVSLPWAIIVIHMD